MTGWSLPKSALVNGKRYRINADFRDILEIIECLNDREEDELTRRYVAMSLFFEDFETIPESDYVEAFRSMADFIAAGEEDDGRPQPKQIDWKQDRNIIAAEINKVAGVEVRALEFLHWWTFVGYFCCIGDGQLATIVSIREKLRKGKKLETYEREFYTKNRTRVDFKQNLTQSEEDIFAKWTGKK